MPSLDTTVTGLVPGQSRASTMSVLASTLWLGQTVGPVALTVVASAAFDDPVRGYRVLLSLRGTSVLACGLVASIRFARGTAGTAATS